MDRLPSPERQYLVFKTQLLEDLLRLGNEALKKADTKLAIRRKINKRYRRWKGYIEDSKSIPELLEKLDLAIKMNKNGFQYEDEAETEFVNNFLSAVDQLQTGTKIF